MNWYACQPGLGAGGASLWPGRLLLRELDTTNNEHMMNLALAEDCFVPVSVLTGCSYSPGGVGSDALPIPPGQHGGIG